MLVSEVKMEEKEKRTYKMPKRHCTMSLGHIPLGGSVKASGCLIEQKAVAQLWLSSSKLMQSQAEPHLQQLPIGSLARLKLSLALWLSQAKPSQALATLDHNMQHRK